MSACALAEVLATSHAVSHPYYKDISGRHRSLSLRRDDRVHEMSPRATMESRTSGTLFQTINDLLSPLPLSRKRGDGYHEATVRLRWKGPRSREVPPIKYTSG